jgi:hypothetical protein
MADREHRLAQRAEEIAQLSRERDASLAEALQGRDRVAQSFDELQTLMAETSAAHATSIAKLDEQLAERERRLAENADEVARLNREHRTTVEQLELELAAREAEAALAVEPEEHAHVLLVPAAAGYTLLERSGPAPAPQALVEIGHGAWGEGSFVVLRTGPSPLPAGPKRCAFLERRSANPS